MYLLVIANGSAKFPIGITIPVKVTEYSAIHANSSTLMPEIGEY